jgi:tetratricopeptide (TPR) repeat protein
MSENDNVGTLLDGLFEVFRSTGDYKSPEATAAVTEYVTAHPIMLTPEFDTALADLEKSMRAEGAVIVQFIRSELRKRRPKSATAESFERLPAEVISLLQNLVDAEKQGDQMKCVELCRLMLDKINEKEFPIPAGMQHMKLGSSLSWLSEHGSPHLLEEAITEYERAIDLLPIEECADVLILAHYNLAKAYGSREPSWDEFTQDIENGIAHGEKARQMMTQYGSGSVPPGSNYVNLAVLYELRDQGEKEDNLDRAVEYLNQALEYYKKEKDKSSIQNTHERLAKVFSRR